MKKSWKRKPWIHKGRTDHNKKGSDDPENNSSEDDRRYSLGLTIFALRPFLISVHGRFSLTEAFPLLSVNSLALQDGRSTIENALF
jgi:hypothetical protein